MSHLKLNQLTLYDYRCFREIRIDFDPDLTVIVASNGAGKTSVLDAIAVALGPYVGAFDEANGKHFLSSDIRLQPTRETKSNEMEYAHGGVKLQATGQIDANGFDGPASVDWQRSLAGPTKAKTTVKDAKALVHYGKRLQSEVRTPGRDVVLPIVAYYGTGRLWQQKKLTISKSLPRRSRTVGYTDCLDSASSYKSFVAWFRYWTTSALEEMSAAHDLLAPQGGGEFFGYLRSVSGAVNTCLAPVGWKDITFSLARDGLIARHEQHGSLAVDMLSDGIRNMIGLVADIAFRATKLNGHLGAHAATHTPGIVLIDEVDMHLHPAWQQTVLASLREAFPLVQFIVTTHSPQVLSVVQNEQIRVIEASGATVSKATVPLTETYGVPSNDVLEVVMQVDPQPPVPERADLDRLTEIIDTGGYESEAAIGLFEKLRMVLGSSHPQLRRLERSIYRQKALKG